MRARKRERTAPDGATPRQTGAAKAKATRARPQKAASKRGTPPPAARQRAAGKRGGGRPTPPGIDLWGDASTLPPPRTDVRITDDPAAVPRSLGKPPLPGHETIAEHYFGVVYERAVMTAGALAAAGGMIDAGDLVEDDDR